MTPAPELTRRLLARPIAERRALVEAGKDAPGWWCWNIDADPCRPCWQEVQRSPSENDWDGWDAEAALEQDWAWFPCSPVVWLAATGVDWQQRVNADGSGYVWRPYARIEDGGYDTAPEAALAYWEGRDRQPTDSEVSDA